jgi:hypothetical protein
VEARLRLLLPCHGGKKKGGGEALPGRIHRLMPEGCYRDSVQDLPRANYVVPSSGAKIFGRMSGRMCYRRRLSARFVGALRLSTAKWFFPGGGEATSESATSLEACYRASSHRISTAMSRGHRRLVVDAPRDLIAF